MKKLWQKCWSFFFTIAPYFLIGLLFFSVVYCFLDAKFDRYLNNHSEK